MSGIYAAIQQAMLTGAFNWTSGTYALMLVGPGYTPNYATDTTLNNIPSGSRLLTSPVALSGETASGGNASANGVVWSSLTTASAIKGIAILQENGGAATTWPLVCYIDQGDGFGQTPSSVPVTVAWDARGIFAP